MRRLIGWVMVIGSGSQATGCTTGTPRPSAHAYPTKGQSAAQVSRDQTECQAWAIQQTGFDPTDTARGAGVGAVIGALTGAAAGAAIGAAAGSAGTGAAVGAAAGGIGGAGSVAPSATRRARRAMTGHTPSALKRAAMRSDRRFWFPAMAILLAGCASARVSGGAYINETKRFTARLPSDAWRVEAGESPDLLLRHRSRQAGMSIHATCGRVPAGRSVEVVGRHLFFGIERKDVLEQERWPTAGGEGLELLVRGKLDGRELLLHSYTLKDPGCVYDLVLFADSKDYVAVNPDFEAFVHGFRRLPERQ